MSLRAVVDALGRPLRVPAAPRRIVSLVPSLTEWLCALGLDDRVVGITDFCTRPAAVLRDKARVGGTKNPRRDRISALQPDLVLAAKEENRERDVAALAAAGLAVYVVDPCTVAGAIGALAAIAALLDADAAAAPQLSAMRAALAEVSALPVPPAARVLVPIWRDPWMAVGADTYAHDLLERCGAHNVAAELPGRYPRFELDAGAALRPDRILLPSEPYAFGARDRADLQQRFDGRIDFVDGELLTWYGPRLPEALHTFARLLRAAHGEP